MTAVVPDDAYLAFLRSKIPQAEVAGFEPPTEAHASFFPHQREIAQWAIRGGRRGLFLAFGLGKTRINLQLGLWVTQQTGGRYLIVCPLGVRHQFLDEDGPAMGIPVAFVRTTAEAMASPCRIVVTNYESVREGKIDPAAFAGAGLDEASVLRSFGSKTYQEFLPLFKAVRYRFVFTATPSPNRYKELIHYAGFLGVMDTGEALTRFFERNSSQAGDLNLYPHMEQTFWTWMSSWACFVSSPADLGYDATGYDLPPMHVHWHKVDVDHTKAWGQVDSWGQRQLILDQATGLAEGAAIKRESIALRVAKARELMRGVKVEGESERPSSVAAKHWILWHDLEAERAEIERAIPAARTVYGTQDLEEREGLILGFSRGAFPVLATKPIIAGSGCNFQRHCSNAIFLGAGYKFNDFIQAVHRIYRFQQPNEVHIHIIYLESESAIVEELQRKWRNHNALMARMSEILREHGLRPLTDMRLLKTIELARREVRGEHFRCINADCVMEAREMAEGSVGLIVTSIPFGTQYEYCPSYNDFGHNADNAAFFEQMDFLVPELLRVLEPGRVACIHVKDRIRFGNVTGDGFPTVEPFSDHTVAAFTKHGFRLMARITIDTDVVRENAQTYRLSMKEVKKDGTKMGAGMPEYVLVFRKLPSDTGNGYADVPVPLGGVKVKVDSESEGGKVFTVADWQVLAAGLWESSGDRLLDPEILVNMPHPAVIRAWREYAGARVYDYREHVAVAEALLHKGTLPGAFMLFPPISKHPDVWDDIIRMRTLNSEQGWRGEEKHVCPLQLDVVERLITRYSNEGEVVYDPFGGIGTVPYKAVLMRRQGWMTELNTDYWKSACGYCERAEATAGAPTLFDYARGFGSTEGNEENEGKEVAA